MKIVYASILILAMSLPAKAVIFVNQDLAIDFTDPNAIHENVLSWTPAEQVKRTSTGLVFQNPGPAASVDFALTTKPYALGLSWRPTYGAQLNVELSPLGKEEEFSGGTLYPTFYFVYVRYSPDLKNWSSWCVMQDKYPDWETRKKAGKYQYYLQLRVPDKERTEYVEYLSRYGKMDVPWTSDEEAMVKWILTKEPDFFQKHIPFIGYVQFLCESSLRANQTLSQMKISIGWGVGGLHSLPKDESVYQNRDNIPWRYKAPDATLTLVNDALW